MKTELNLNLVKKIRSMYSQPNLAVWHVEKPNVWDLIAIVAILGALIVFCFYCGQMAGRYQLGQPIPIYLDIKYLPTYSIRTTIRLFVALLWSLLFTFIVGTWAAKSQQAARIILPVLDILQSVPILSFLSFAISAFIMLFKGRLLGPEFAAIFGVFTSQVWNITLGFYQSLSSVPSELNEVGVVFGLTPWQRLWKIEVPYCLPSLIWNAMVSMSGSWFFVIACETFSVAGSDVTLPGIGSYIYQAISHADIHAIYAAIVAMLLVILLYDQLIFRPLVYWTEIFKEEEEEENENDNYYGDEDAVTSQQANHCPWVVSLFRRGKLIHILGRGLGHVSRGLINCRLFNWLFSLPHVSYGRRDNDKTAMPRFSEQTQLRAPMVRLAGKIGLLVVAGLLLTGVGYLAHYLYQAILTKFTFYDLVSLLALGVFTSIRVMSLVLLATVIWVPIGVWIGLRPRLVKWMQPLLQFVAAFPANLLFPSFAILIISFKLNVELWVSPLMILGTQWYILFNVIAGVSQLPKDLRLVAQNLQVTGWLWWKRLILPHIAPYLVTGVMTAAGGAWNASIVAEVVAWGNIRLEATGLGAYIQKNFETGNTENLVMGTIVMCLFVLFINRLIWQPLYNHVINRF